jgi:citrate synthase
MPALHDRLAAQIPVKGAEISGLIKEHGSKVISDVTVAQAYGGMRGIKSLICDTSIVEPDRGLVIRGIPIADLDDRLPEEIFFLLNIGELPSDAELKDLQQELGERSHVPDYVWDVLRACPKDSHPMAMLSIAIMALEKESVFRKRYDEGMKRGEYWEPALEDSLTLLARLPGLAAGLYRIRFDKGDIIPSDPSLDWGANYAHMLGIDDPTGEFANLMRLYLVLHSDHESGNVSAFTGHTVGSALSDIYYALAAGLNGLAGPLHGLANQECLKFVLEIRDKFNGVPTADELVQYCWDTLNSGKVLPGYGHAVLRATDPRFTAFHAFGKRVCPDDDTVAIVDLMFQNVPTVLKEQGKAKNPYPNVDAGSGALLYHFGMTEFDYYTVLFGVSRAMGIMSQYIYNRAYQIPITRPKSVGTDWIQETVSKM